MLSGFNLEPQSLQPRQFACEISEGYLERDVIDGGSCSVRPIITRALRAVEQGEHLGVTAVALRNLEERTGCVSGYSRQADDLLVELLHGIQIVDAQCNLPKATHRRALLVSN